jgi:hypothetical protein
MDYIIARRLPVGFELSDSKGQDLGFALALRHAQRFAAEAGVPPPLSTRSRERGLTN